MYFTCFYALATMMTTSITNLLSNLLDIFTALLELYLSSNTAASSPFGTNDPSSSAQYHHDDDDNANGKDTDAALSQAFVLLELDSQSATREDAKKKYHRLSLLNHPDRNGNTEESVATTQKINHAYDLIQVEFDRREGIIHDDDDNDDEQQEESTYTPAAEQQQKKRYSRRNAASSETKSHRNTNRKRREKKYGTTKKQRGYERRERERTDEYQREWGDINRQRMRIQREILLEQRARRSVRDDELDTKQARKVANRRWEREMKWQQEAEETTTNGQDPSKPKNPVMERCLNEVVVALRLGLIDAAITFVQDGMQSAFVARARKLRRYDLSGSDIQWVIDTFLQKPLDDDGNALLHYAAYYESMDLVGMIYLHASRGGVFPSVFLQKNTHGHVPLDFCQSSELRPRLEGLTEQARDMVPSFRKSGLKLWNLARRFDFVALINANASVLCGLYIFGLALSSSLFVSTFHLWSIKNDDFVTFPVENVVKLWGLYLTWYIYSSLLSLLQQLFWKCVALVVIISCLLFGWQGYILVPHRAVRIAFRPMNGVKLPMFAKRLGDLPFLLLFALGSLVMRAVFLGPWERFHNYIMSSKWALLRQ